MTPTNVQKLAVLTFALAMLFLSSAALRGPQSAQQPGVPASPGFPQQSTSSAHQLGGNESAVDSGVKAEMEAKRMKFVAEDRHKHMAADAAKLLELASEIKTEVDKTTNDELSLTVIKKATEMEKLSHDIRTRMTN